MEMIKGKEQKDLEKANRKDGFRAGIVDGDGEGKNRVVSADKGGAAALQAAPGAIMVRRSRGLIPEITLSMPEPKGKASTTIRC